MILTVPMKGENGQVLGSHRIWKRKERRKSKLTGVLKLSNEKNDDVTKRGRTNLRGKSFIHSLTNIKCLLYARHCSRH